MVLSQSEVTITNHGNILTKHKLKKKNILPWLIEIDDSNSYFHHNSVRKKCL